jgi:hypothetical protein
MSTSFKTFFLSGCPINALYAFLPHTCHMPRPSHPYRFDRPNSIWYAVQIITQFSPVSWHFPNILLTHIKPSIPSRNSVMLKALRKILLRNQNMQRGVQGGLLWTRQWHRWGICWLHVKI